MRRSLFSFVEMAFIYVVLILGFCFIACDMEPPEGHMMPLGSHVKPDDVDEITMENMISSEDFYYKYVIPKKPVVFRGVGKSWPAFSKFTDEYLKSTYGDLQLRMEGKKEKQTRVPIGDISMGRDSMRNFINTYHEPGPGSKKYIVSELPRPMYHEVSVIPPMTCGPFRDNLVEIDLWINGGNASSILHRDAFNTLNCVVNGSKDWKLVALEYNDFVYQAWEGDQEAGYGGYSLINPEKVDLIKFPRVAQIPRWQHTIIEKGDCLHLPTQMWHHVKSSGEMNLAVAFLFSRFDERHYISSVFNDCQDPISRPLSEFDVDWQYPGHGELTMGYMELAEHRQNLFRMLNKDGVLSKKRVYRIAAEFLRGKKVEYILERAEQLYRLLKSFNDTFTRETIQKLTKADLRLIGKAVELQEASNTLDLEHAYISSETIRDHFQHAFDVNPLGIAWDKFLRIYTEDILGSEAFAKTLFRDLVGDGKDVLTLQDFEANFAKATEKYDWYVLIVSEEDEDKYIQGFKVESKHAEADFVMDVEREHLRNKRKSSDLDNKKSEL